MKAIRHTGIVVGNLEKALNFYRDLLGLSIVREMDESGEYVDMILALDNVEVKTVKLAAEDNNLVELLYFKTHYDDKKMKKELYSLGCSHIAFTVDNLDELYSKLVNSGVKFNSLPQVSLDGFAKVAFCQDPEGNFIELVEVLSEVSQ